MNFTPEWNGKSIQAVNQALLRTEKAVHAGLGSELM
jgi:hypothetical protein